MDKSDLKIICLTPVLNEEWIIEKFLKAASIWADVVIISDQGSTDRSIEIASKFPKVKLIDNSKITEYNENDYRQPLYNEARKILGPKLLINIDADEFLTPNFDDLEWDTIKNAPLGTRFIFNWYNIQPNFISYFYDEKPLAFIDDGAEYNCGVLHEVRIPLDKNATTIKLNNIGILHYQFLNWERMELKHMWYRMYEKVINPKKNSISIWRRYHYEKNIPIDYQHVYPLPKEWIAGYNKYNIEITSFKKIQETLWDKRMVDYISKYGWKRFKYLDIDISYVRSIDYEKKLKSIKMKYNFIDFCILYYLKMSQKNKTKIRIKLIDYFLMKIIK